MGQDIKLQYGGHALLLGTGYVARSLINPLKARGFRITGTTRAPEKAQTLSQQLNIEMTVFDGAITPQMAQVLPHITHLIASIGPDHQGRDPFLDAYWEALAKHKSSHLRSLSWAAYLSATSVYGDRQGQWVFENELLRPGLKRGRARIEAELAWLESGLPVHIFRLAGIYGQSLFGMPRHPFEKLKNGQAHAVVKPGHVVNRIHVDDIARALLASMDKPDPTQVYNVADGHPAPPHTVLNFAADLLGIGHPPLFDYENAPLSNMARTFYQETKRIKTTLIQKKLGWKPAYPTYREGLMAVHRAEYGHPEHVYQSGYILTPNWKTPKIAKALKTHINLSRLDDGCIRFDVWPDPHIDNKFYVVEIFSSTDSFQSHQRRSQSSEWAEISKDVSRYYWSIGLET